MKTPLPASPLDPIFCALMRSIQLEYIKSERARYRDAMRLAPYDGLGTCRMSRQRVAAWYRRGLHPQTPDELQARLDGLNSMESRCSGPDYVPGSGHMFMCAQFANSTIPVEVKS